MNWGSTGLDVRHRLALAGGTHPPTHGTCDALLTVKKESPLRPGGIDVWVKNSKAPDTREEEESHGGSGGRGAIDHEQEREARAA